MDTEQIISLGQQALTTTLLLASPVLLIGLAAAIITAFIQTLFQMQEATV
ncbi:MAG: flagellar biosynthetic protein FliQ, partial [Thermoguttaceae bacterium]|nr:flagellar biosynthetic protein FliQ [Thermoguttaceae bacterium]